MTAATETNIMDLIQADNTPAVNTSVIVKGNEAGKNDNIIKEHKNGTLEIVPPWASIGKTINLDNLNAIDDSNTVIEAVLNQTGLNWNAAKEPALFQSPTIIDQQTGKPALINVPGQYVVHRQDTEFPLGVVGNRYTIHQNRMMVEFVEALRKSCNGHYTVGGLLRNGQTTFLMINVGNHMIVDGDEIESYLLIRNSFNGSTPFQAIFTNFRLQCYNALTGTFKQQRDRFNIHHTANMAKRLATITKLIQRQELYHTNFITGMKALTQREMTLNQMIEILEDVIFPLKKKPKAVEGEPTNASTLRQKNIDKVVELIETGAGGTDLPGVRGTAYGFYNALTDFADHHARTRTTDKVSDGDRMFERAFISQASTEFKQRSLNTVIDLI